MAHHPLRPHCVSLRLVMGHVSTSAHPRSWGTSQVALWLKLPCLLVGAGLDREPWRGLSEQAYGCGQVAPPCPSFAEAS